MKCICWIALAIDDLLQGCLCGDDEWLWTGRRGDKGGTWRFCHSEATWAKDGGPLPCPMTANPAQPTWPREADRVCPFLCRVLKSMPGSRVLSFSLRTCFWKSQCRSMPGELQYVTSDTTHRTNLGRFQMPSKSRVVCSCLWLFPVSNLLWGNRILKVTETLYPHLRQSCCVVVYHQCTCTSPDWTTSFLRASTLPLTLSISEVYLTS